MRMRARDVILDHRFDRRFGPLLLVGALVLGPACDEPSAPPPAAEATPATPEPPAAPPTEADADTKRVDIAAAAPPTVTVKDAGADPKEVLRLTPKVGVDESLVMTMTMKVGMAMGGQKLPVVTTPPMIVDAHVRLDDISPGMMSVVYAIDGMHVGPSKDADPAMVQTLKSMLEGLKPFEAHLQMDQRGALHSGHVDVPQDLPAPIQQLTEQLQQSLAQIAVPLPEEAVGVGAKWTAVSTVEQGGMKIEQIADYALEARDGAALDLKVAVTQKLLDPNFSPPGMPGVKAKINAFQSGGTATVAMSLGHLSPTSMTSNIKLKMTLNISAMGQEQQQDMEMEMGLQMGRK